MPSTVLENPCWRARLCISIVCLIVMSFGCFKLNASIVSVTSAFGGTPRLALDPQFTNFRAFSTSPAQRYGDYQSDLDSRKFNKSWPSWEAFEAFLVKEQETHLVELRKVQTASGADRYSFRTFYVCSRHGTGGKKDYQKKNPDWNRKIPTKRTDCACSLTVKTYPGTDAVLGIYHSEHNHPLGNQNLRFTRISNDTREWIAGMVRMRVQSDHIVSNIF